MRINSRSLFFGNVIAGLSGYRSSREDTFVPDTISPKMQVDVQEPGNRPLFRLEESDHPLSQEYHHGITPERVKEITFRSIPAQEQ